MVLEKEVSKKKRNDRKELKAHRNLKDNRVHREREKNVASRRTLSRGRVETFYYKTIMMMTGRKLSFRGY